MLPVSVTTLDSEMLFGRENAYRVIKEAGFDAVDASINVMMRYAQASVRCLPELMQDGREKELLEAAAPWRDGAKEYHLDNYQAHAPFPSLMMDDAADPFNETMLAVMKKYLMLCDYINCRRLVIHPAFCDYKHRLTAEQEWEINMERYASLIPAAKKYGVMILLENMFISHNKRIYEAVCSDIPTTCRYIDELNALAGEKVFGFCLDTGHLLLLGKDIKDAMIQLGDRIEAFHIHDNDGITDQHLAPYMGVMDWERFMQGLEAIQYRKTLSFETGSIANRYPKELYPQALRLLAETGRMFGRRAMGE